MEEAEATKIKGRKGELVREKRRTRVKRRRETHKFRINPSLLCTLVSESYSTQFRTKLEILDVGHVWRSEVVLSVVGFGSSGLEERTKRIEGKSG